MISGVSQTLQETSLASGSADVSYEAPEERTTLDREDFTMLFVTQLQYQDPLKPMESAEMASQVAQFNMVDLMQRNNESMETLVEIDGDRIRLEAVSFLGHEVRYPGTSITVGSEGPKPMDIELEEPAVSCVATILDSEGQVVRSWDLGVTASGSQPLDWDGTNAEGDAVPEGEYRIYFEAVNEWGEEVSVTPITTGVISGITYQDEGLPLLVLENGEEVQMAEIQKVGG